ncbi:UNVERIFIED_CONTAM: putative mitochondrial protein [Sesamum latifolium]|uniref:Mitochondrial protein n=1 Tax=Sesamum latifolium TaxID=2727402 RepID=A0AAW2XI60_9LAMI
MVDDLLQPFTEEEITNALFQMSPLKSGPDGMPQIFFHKFWNIHSKDVIKCTLSLLNNLELLHELNRTAIVLIPKCNRAENLTQFLPIILYNVVYKIDSKALANRIKPILDKIISPTQAAFAPRRLITDYVLIAYEGDPLSPYPFLLCTEALSSLIHRAEAEGRIDGVAISRRAPPISHLLFADVTLLCFQATKEAMECIGEILQCYGRASGQEVNLQKSTAVFSCNIQSDQQDNLSAILGIRREEAHDKYLGLPSLVGKSRRAVFSSIRDRVWTRIQGWGDKLLSQAGKSILIKSVLQSIPTYAMGCFRLPLSLINELHSMTADCLWHHRDERKIHWLAWRKFCTQKKYGGLGFRDLKAFNAAMLAK